MTKIERLATRSERIAACERKERGYMPDTNEMIDDIVNQLNEMAEEINAAKNLLMIVQLMADSP